MKTTLFALMAFALISSTSFAQKTTFQSMSLAALEKRDLSLREEIQQMWNATTPAERLSVFKLFTNNGLFIKEVVKVTSKYKAKNVANVDNVDKIEVLAVLVLATSDGQQHEFSVTVQLFRGGVWIEFDDVKSDSNHDFKEFLNSDVEYSKFDSAALFFPNYFQDRFYKKDIWANFGKASDQMFKERAPKLYPIYKKMIKLGNLDDVIDQKKYYHSEKKKSKPVPMGSYQSSTKKN